MGQGKLSLDFGPTLRRCSLPDFESTGIRLRCQSGFLLPANVRSKLTGLDRIQKSKDFALIAAYLEFHSAVAKISHPTCDIEPGGDVANRPSKADTLNVTLVI